MTKIKLLLVTSALVFIGAACTPGSIENNADGGIWVSSDAGEEWEQRVVVHVDRRNNITISNLDIKKLVFSPGDSRKIFAVTERNGLWVSWNSGHNWDIILPNSHVADIAVDPKNTLRLYAAVNGDIALSKDEGITWSSAYTSDDPSITITSLELDIKNSNTIYAATSIGELLVSENAGVSWRVLSTISEQHAILRIEFHPTLKNTMYALVSKVGLARSRNNGNAWELFTETFSDFRGADEPRDFALILSGIVYASKFGLLRSLNQGRDWTALPLISGARDANIYSLTVNDNNPLEIFYGTKSTLYRSVDGGFNWIPRQLPTTRVATELVVHPEDKATLMMGVSRRE
jgi:photosystem II stability/assembly factor-like uncharacterized protein